MIRGSVPPLPGRPGSSLDGVNVPVPTSLAFHPFQGLQQFQRPILHLSHGLHHPIQNNEQDHYLAEEQG